MWSHLARYPETVSRETHQGIETHLACGDGALIDPHRLKAMEEAIWKPSRYGSPKPVGPKATSLLPGFRVEVYPALIARVAIAPGERLALVDAFPTNLLMVVPDAFNQAVGLVLLHPRVRLLPVLIPGHLRCVGPGPSVHVIHNEGHRGLTII